MKQSAATVKVGTDVIGLEEFGEFIGGKEVSDVVLSGSHFGEFVCPFCRQKGNVNAPPQK